ncbi:hypothetical protein BH23CHL2_BH23CHL2_22120 [soil metagenome]
MTISTDDLISKTWLPDSILQLLDIRAESSDDIWRRRFQALIKQLPILLYTAAPDNLTQIEYINSQSTLWLGYSRDEWTAASQQFVSRLHPEDRPRVLASDAEAIATGNNFTIEFRLQAQDGAWHWVRDSAVLLRDRDGVAVAWQGVTIDITELKTAEAGQYETRRLYRSLIDQIPAIVYRESTDSEPVQLYVSPQVEELLGYTPEEWLGARCIWGLILHPDDRDRLDRNTGVRPRDTSSHDEYRLVTKDGRTIWVREDRALLLDDRGEPDCWQGLLIDITRQKQLEEQLVYQARHDSLTGLPNRTYFTEIVTKALEQGANTRDRIAVLFLDLDGFKELNDSRGHQVGDELLIEIGKRLQAALRSGDIVARLGGDEFAILPTQPANENDIVKLAERVMTALRQPLTIRDHETHYSGSLGIAFGTAGEDSLFDLLRWADLAMYRAKASGKNRYAFFETESS